MLCEVVVTVNAHRLVGCRFAYTRCQSECCACAASCDVDPEDPSTWHVDPLRCPLPHAPSLQMFCLYGVGKPTERAYQYLNLQTEEVLPGCPAAWLRALRGRAGSGPASPEGHGVQGLLQLACIGGQEDASPELGLLGRHASAALAGVHAHGLRARAAAGEVGGR